MLHTHTPTDLASLLYYRAALPKGKSIQTQRITLPYHAACCILLTNFRHMSNGAEAHSLL